MTRIDPLAAVASLSACGATGPTSFVPTAEPAASTTETVTEPAVIEGDTDGNGKLSEFEKQVAAKHAPRDYTLPDGTVISIDPGKPLPEEVLAKLRADALPHIAIMQENANLVSGDAYMLMKADMDADADATGKGLVYVYNGLSSIPGTIGETEMLWLTSASNVRVMGIMGTPDFETLYAAADSWASKRGYEVVVIE